MLGVLLHAGLLVRHHGAMLQAHLQYQALAADLAAAFCHGGTQEGTARSPGDLPGVPKPSNPQGDCPACCGQATALALLAPDGLTVPVRFAALARWIEPERTNPALRHAVCPPPRGPPASARLA